MKSFLSRGLLLAAVSLLCGAASCEKSETEQIAPSNEPVHLVVRYTVAGTTASSPAANLGVGTGSYRKCYDGACPKGARAKLDREALANGTYTLDLGLVRPDTTRLFVAAWVRMPRLNQLPPGYLIRAEVLANNELVEAVTLTDADQTSGQWYISDESQADLVKEIEVSWPQ